MKIFKGETAYYSHSVRIFNTSNEEEEIEFLKKSFVGKVICPNQDANLFKKVSDYQKVIYSVDVLFVSEFNGYIGMGSYKDCKIALDNQTPIYSIERNGTSFNFRKVVDVRVNDDGNRAQYAILASVKI